MVSREPIAGFGLQLRARDGVEAQVKRGHRPRNLGEALQVHDYAPERYRDVREMAVDALQDHPVFAAHERSSSSSADEDEREIALLSCRNTLRSRGSSISWGVCACLS